MALKRPVIMLSGGIVLNRQNRRCLSLFLGILFIISLKIGSNILLESVRYGRDTQYKLNNDRLRRADFLQKQNVSKLFLFAYMRGGSSIAGELFNCDPSATMWYEPGDAFFSAYYGLFHENLPQNDLYFTNMTRRKLESSELDAMANFYNNIFSCNYEQLPPETMAHYFLGESSAMDEYLECKEREKVADININDCKSHIRQICSSNKVETALRANCHMVISAVEMIMKRHDSVRNESELLNFLQDLPTNQSFHVANITSEDLVSFIRHGLCIEKMRENNAICMDIAKGRCSNDKLIVVQVNRMKMEDLESIIQDNPGIRVVHYTRDPRAIAYSRIRTGLLNSDQVKLSTIREAEYLCHKMREDIRQRMILERKYPGVFTHFTYESLALDPEGFATKIYGIFNETYPREWKAFIAKHMHADVDGGAYGITVRNSAETAFKWRTQIPDDELEVVNNLCLDVIVDLDYDV